MASEKTPLVTQKKTATTDIHYDDKRPDITRQTPSVTPAGNAYFEKKNKSDDGKSAQASLQSNSSQAKGLDACQLM